MALRQVYTQFVQGVVATAQWMARTRPAVRMRIVVSGLWRPTARLGVRACLAPMRLLSKQRTGLRLRTLVSGAWLPRARVAERLRTVVGLRRLQRVGVRHQRLVFNLTGTYGATSATNSTVTGTAWQNPANATGKPNGAVASHPGALSAQDAWLYFEFPTMFQKDALTITRVRLLFYATQSGTVLANGNLRFSRGTRAAKTATTLATHTGDIDTLAFPQAFDVTAAYDTWAKISDVGVAIRHTAAAGQLHTATVDAVVLEVTATATQAL